MPRLARHHRQLPFLDSLSKIINKHLEDEIVRVGTSDRFHLVLNAGDPLLYLLVFSLHCADG